VQRRCLSDVLVDSPPHICAEKGLENHCAVQECSDNLQSRLARTLLWPAAEDTYVVRIPAPAAFIDRKVPRQECDRQANNTGELETNVAAHGEPRIRAMNEEPRADDSSRREDEESESSEQSVEEYQTVVV
jgi:hypothetical protein